MVRSVCVSMAICLSFAFSATAKDTPADEPAPGKNGGTHRQGDTVREDYVVPLVRLDDPTVIVRQNARFRAAQRRRRITARHWFGMSNSRPTASSTPWLGTYSPQWVANTSFPFGWAGAGGVW